jgi:YVTN family beta-propeller protein
VRTADVGEKPGYLALTKDGTRAYFARPFDATVSIMDTATLTVVDTITVGKGPSVVTIRHDP